MPPTLDLSTTTHPKMIISPPRINLRRAASYNYDKGPLSSTSSRFSFNHLVFSPPPSPGLPSLSPPPKRPPKGFTGFIRPRRVVRLVLSILVILVIFRGLSWLFENHSSPPALQWAPEKHLSLEMLENEAKPKSPAAVAITDKNGQSKWTVSIPQTHEFPLAMGGYARLCAECRELSDKIRKENSRDHSLTSSYLEFGFGSSDSGFIDVRDAQRNGYIPSSEQDGRGTTQEPGMPLCTKSLTVVLESADAGIGSTLMMLWTAYGLAQKEGRAFFVDDTRWAYGKYSDIFQSPPSPGCSPPLNHERIPCPRQARHLVVTKTTFQKVFSELIVDQAGPKDAFTVSARKTAFSLARKGHDVLFHLNKDDGEYVDARVRDLLSKRIVPKTKGKQDGVAVGVHIRRGDRHPFEYQYRDSYIPLENYVETASSLIADRVSHSGGSNESVSAKDHSFLIVASDDPMVYENSDVKRGATKGSMYPAQDRIRLASKQAIQKANPPDKSVMHKFSEEAFGWEGGFFSAMFWNLGMGPASKTNANTNAVNMAKAAPPPPSQETLRLRSLVGRAYVMDLAVLSDASDAIVCAVSSVGCRLLAVMMGWDSAIERGNWVNIDGGYGWLGV
ncbi:hypothetical protein V8F20_001971 [Naviculisporaceae sp. PSN 640]